MTNYPDETSDVQTQNFEAKCRDCSVPIPADASTCHQCGYEGYEGTPAEAAGNLAMIGLGLTVFLVTAPIGLPLLALGLFLVTWCKIFRRGDYRPQA